MVFTTLEQDVRKEKEVTTLCFRIDGQPYAQKRHRSTKSGRTYSPPENTVFKRKAQAAMKLVLYLNKREAPYAPKGVPVHLTIRAFFKRPKAAKDDYYREKKPDADNLAKAIMDAGNGVMWHDDAQIVTLTVRKVYADNPHTFVEVGLVYPPTIR
jgi:Holliday junction resolvase RusA-like endonuclease